MNGFVSWPAARNTAMGIGSSLVRSRALRSALRLGLAIALCLAVVGGCGKKDTVVGPPATPTYPALTSPEQVLVALKMAYERKDSTEYKLLFDQGYVGTSVDQSAQTPIDSLTFADEAQHIAALARSTTAIVGIQLTPTMTRSRDSADPPGWALIQDPIHSLAIYDSPNIFAVDVTSETMEFRFIPKTPDSTSPTDTTWKIIRWSEVAH